MQNYTIERARVAALEIAGLKPLTRLLELIDDQQPPPPPAISSPLTASASSAPVEPATTLPPSFASSGFAAFTAPLPPFASAFAPGPSVKAPPPSVPSKRKASGDPTTSSTPTVGPFGGGREPSHAAFASSSSRSLRFPFESPLPSAASSTSSISRPLTDASPPAFADSMAVEEDWTKRLQLRSAKSTLTRGRRRRRALPARDMCILQLDGNWKRFDAVDSGSESEANSEAQAAPVLASSSAAKAAAAVKVAALSPPPSSPVFMELELEDESRTPNAADPSARLALCALHSSSAACAVELSLSDDWLEAAADAIGDEESKQQD